MRRNDRLNLAAIHNGFTYQLQAVEAVKGMEFAALFHEQGLGKSGSRPTSSTRSCLSRSGV